MKLYLRNKDKLLILFLLIFFILVGYLSFIVFSEFILVILIITISSTLLVFIFEFYRRLNDKSTQIVEQQIQSKTQQENNYKQIESALSLFHTIKPDLPLPKMRGWAASPDFLKRIVYEVLSRKPNLIVEASSGVSTLMISYTLKKIGHGRVISLENDKKYYRKTKKLIKNHGLEEYSTLMYAPLKKVTIDGKSFKWYDTTSLELESAIDMLIIDGPIGSLQKLSRYPALPKFYEKLAENGVVLLDDGNRQGEKEIVNLWVAKYPHIRSEYLELEKGGYILFKEEK